MYCLHAFPLFHEEVLVLFKFKMKFISNKITRNPINLLDKIRDFRKFTKLIFMLLFEAKVSRRGNFTKCQQVHFLSQLTTVGANAGSIMQQILWKATPFAIH